MKEISLEDQNLILKTALKEIWKRTSFRLGDAKFMTEDISEKTNKKEHDVISVLGKVYKEAADESWDEKHFKKPKEVVGFQQKKE